MNHHLRLWFFAIYNYMEGPNQMNQQLIHTGYHNDLLNIYNCDVGNE